MNQWLSTCEEAARAGGSVLRKWAGRINAKEKAPADLVTEADVASQQAIRDLVLARFPDHDFLGEEGGPPTGSKSPFRWVVDPLDGTTNYVHGFPSYAVSIALEQHGQVIVACVFDPVADECFTASRGGGAWLNGRRLAASRVQTLPQALIAASFQPGTGRNALEVQQFLEVLDHSQSIRRIGSAALNLCYLAAGRLDAYWALNTHLWDIAAGWLLVTEAGGVFTGAQGQPFDAQRPSFLAAANLALHGELLTVLNSVEARLKQEQAAQ